MKNLRLVIVRHGETDWSKAEKHTGLTDIPLNDKGRSDASKLNERLSSFHFTHIFSSPLKRAHETCALAGFAKRAEIIHDLVEWNYGEYEGMTTSEIRKQNPNWDLFTQGPLHGETLLEISSRADRVLRRLENESGDIALFSSAHFLRVLTARWIGLSASHGKLFYLAPASVSILGFEREAKVLQLWNEHFA